MERDEPNAWAHLALLLSEEQRADQRKWLDVYRRRPACETCGWIFEPSAGCVHAVGSYTL